MSELAWNAGKELTVEEKEWRAKQFTDGPKADLVQYENGFLVRRRLINHMSTACLNEKSGKNLTRG